MANKLVFSKIQRKDIFCEDFESLTENNIVEFSSDGIVVIYGPNGVGKTSLSKVLSSAQDTELEFFIEGKKYTESDNDLFHVIADQNGRNIIKGETHEFLLGDNIEKEYNLKKSIDEHFSDLFRNIMPGLLKTEFNISSKSSNLIKLIPIALKGYIESIANNRDRGDSIDRDKFFEELQTIKKYDLEDYDEEKYAFFKKDYEGKESVIVKILEIKENSIKKNEDIRKINEYNHAIDILDKFIYKTDCIVCDNEINSKEILKRKLSNREEIITSLDKDTREILEDIINMMSDDDPFIIKEKLLGVIENGDVVSLNDLIIEIEFYINIFKKKISNEFVSCSAKTDLREDLNKYKEILKNKPEFTAEDILFIQKIVSDNIERDIVIDRDSNNNLKILMDNNEIFNREREDLNLSNGEQNFISLSFELLKARNSDKDIIVLDDPISSFDSIYKNKLAFVIIKFLESKKTIILTHNLDMVRLMEVQKNNCFILYLFNNTENETNGFVRVNENEQEILLYINELLDLFRDKILQEVIDHELFLVSVIPFMRGYAQMIGDKDNKNKLTKLMHGYENEAIEVSSIYNELFLKDNSAKMPNLSISVEEVLNINLDNIEILKTDNYPLLDKTLRHSLMYLFLRLQVEKVLVEKFKIDYNKHQHLGDIIWQSFKNKEDLNNRVYLMSRKTLLNEFNHFDGNMNIFQPAIDISDTSLLSEKEGILDLLGAYL